MELFAIKFVQSFRPKTTTINERGEEEGEDGEEGEGDVMLDENLETLQPPKIKRTHSRNGDLLGHHEQVGRNWWNSVLLLFQGLHRKLSRHMGEDDEDMIKMKQYMEQKGLW